MLLNGCICFGVAFWEPRKTMNQREAKLRALKLCLHVLKDAIDSGAMADMVDDDTTDEEAERIVGEADVVRFALHKRIQRLEVVS